MLEVALGGARGLGRARARPASGTGGLRCRCLPVWLCLFLSPSLPLLSPSLRGCPPTCTCTHTHTRAQPHSLAPTLVCRDTNTASFKTTSEPNATCDGKDIPARGSHRQLAHSGASGPVLDDTWVLKRLCRRWSPRPLPRKRLILVPKQTRKPEAGLPVPSAPLPAPPSPRAQTSCRWLCHPLRGSAGRAAGDPGTQAAALRAPGTVKGGRGAGSAGRVAGEGARRTQGAPLASGSVWLSCRPLDTAPSVSNTSPRSCQPVS